MKAILILSNQEYLIEIFFYLMLCPTLYFIYVLIKKCLKLDDIPYFNLEKEIEAYETEKANRTYNGKTMKEILEAPYYDICEDPIYIKAVEQNEALDNIIGCLNKHLSLQDLIIRRLQEGSKNIEILVTLQKSSKL